MGVLANVYVWTDFFYRIWDLSLERDEEEEAEFKAKTKEEVNAPTDLPPQLLFVHQVCIYIYIYLVTK